MDDVDTFQRQVARRRIIHFTILGVILLGWFGFLGYKGLQFHHTRDSDIEAAMQLREQGRLLDRGTVR